MISLSVPCNLRPQTHFHLQPNLTNTTPIQRKNITHDTVPRPEIYDIEPLQSIPPTPSYPSTHTHGKSTIMPTPSLNLQIPSYLDAHLLDARVYLPPSYTAPVTQHWDRKLAIIGHPYAPLGGSYDDHIVLEVVKTLLRAGWVVSTFNFRYDLEKQKENKDTLDERG